MIREHLKLKYTLSHKAASWLSKQFILAIFITFIKLTFTFLWVATLSELSYILAGDEQSSSSTVVWFIWLVICISIMVFTTAQSLWYIVNAKSEPTYWLKCFQGLGSRKLDKIQNALFFIRRFLLVSTGNYFLLLYTPFLNFLYQCKVYHMIVRYKAFTVIPTSTKVYLLRIFPSFVE